MSHLPISKVVLILSLMPSADFHILKTLMFMRLSPTMTSSNSFLINAPTMRLAIYPFDLVLIDKEQQKEKMLFRKPQAGTPNLRLKMGVYKSSVNII